MPGFKKILCQVDFDQNSLLALRLASELAQERKGTPLLLLHVVELPPGPEVALPFGKMETDARARIEKLARRRVKGKARYEVDIMMGDPSAHVLQAAKRWGANLIGDLHDGESPGWRWFEPQRWHEQARRAGDGIFTD